MPTPKKLEVHEHSYITGPNAKIAGRKLVHSHAGGDRGHVHAHTGPGAYTIDRDDWYRATGLRGGGRKTFTAKPTGPQLRATPYRAGYVMIAMTPTGADAALSTTLGVRRTSRRKRA